AGGSGAGSAVELGRWINDWSDREREAYLRGWKAGGGDTETMAQLRADLEAARAERDSWKSDAELQSERVTEQRLDLLPQIASLENELAQTQANRDEVHRWNREQVETIRRLEAELVQAQARLAAQERVIQAAKAVVNGWSAELDEAEMDLLIGMLLDALDAADAAWTRLSD
ncbi:MAG TPA: hypothetical protein VFG86_08050, partial [Chloroflexota bacterium]|nr:hypothetical protein [Chloroflexota bacterium]